MLARAAASRPSRRRASRRRDRLVERERVDVRASRPRRTSGRSRSDAVGRSRAGRGSERRPSARSSPTSRSRSGSPRPAPLAAAQQLLVGQRDRPLDEPVDAQPPRRRGRTAASSRRPCRSASPTTGSARTAARSGAAGPLQRRPATRASPRAATTARLRSPRERCGGRRRAARPASRGRLPGHPCTLTANQLSTLLHSTWPGFSCA